MVVASSAFSRHIFGVLAGCNLFRYFERIISFDTTLSLKSNKRYFQQAFEFLAVPPQDCIFIGNSLYEVLLPASLGCKTVTITRERGSQTPFALENPLDDSFMSARQADLVLPTLKDLKTKLIKNGLITLE